MIDIDFCKQKYKFHNRKSVLILIHACCNLTNKCSSHVTLNVELFLLKKKKKSKVDLIDIAILLFGDNKKKSFLERCYWSSFTLISLCTEKKNTDISVIQVANYDNITSQISAKNKYI